MPLSQGKAEAVTPSRSFAGVFRRAASALMGGSTESDTKDQRTHKYDDTSFEIRSAFQPASAVQIDPSAFDARAHNQRRDIYRRWESISPPADTQLKAISRSAAKVDFFEERNESVEIKMSSQKQQPRKMLQQAVVSPTKELLSFQQETDQAWAMNAIYVWLHRHFQDAKSDAFHRWEIASDVADVETCERKHNIRVAILLAEKERIDRMETIYASGHEIRVTFYSNPNPRCGLNLVVNKHHHCSVRCKKQFISLSCALIAQMNFVNARLLICVFVSPYSTATKKRGLSNGRVAVVHKGDVITNINNQPCGEWPLAAVLRRLERTTQRPLTIDFR